MRLKKFAICKNRLKNIQLDDVIHLLSHQLHRCVAHPYVERVADGRNLPMKEVEEVAQGRVWTGMQAHQMRPGCS